MLLLSRGMTVFAARHVRFKHQWYTEFRFLGRIMESALTTHNVSLVDEGHVVRWFCRRFRFSLGKTVNPVLAFPDLVNSV